MNSHFLSWFSGFFDGEGYISIVPNNKSGYMPQVVIKLRKDDKSILLRIKETLCIGAVYDINNVSTGSPQSKWQVADIDGCVKLIDVLDNYPLLAKKKEVYKVWRSAVLYMKENGRNKHDDYIESAISKMKGLRKYNSTNKSN